MNRKDCIDWKGLETYLSAEVVVCGGGSAGAFAAIAAAREGADVLLVESQGYLGGSAVGALVMPYMTVRVPGEPRCSGLHNELDNRIRAYHQEKHIQNSFDPIIHGILLEQMCRESGVRILLHACVCGAKTEEGMSLGSPASGKSKRICAIVVACKDGIRKIEGKIFIDGTGDGSLSVLAGAGFEAGNPKTGANQPMSLRYFVGGVNKETLGRFLDSLGDPDNARSGKSGGGLFGCVVERRDSALKPIFLQAVAEGDLWEQSMAYWTMFEIPGRKDEVAFNNPEFFDLTDACDPLQLTELQLRGRAFIYKELAFYKKYFKGFENAYISAISIVPGIRESRRIHTKYRLTAMDVLGQRKFKGCISQCNYPVDVHGSEELFREDLPAGDPQKPWYEIPYDCLVGADLENLLVAGRCIGADFVAQSSIRIQICCHSMGEAAGIAAAMCSTKSLLPGQVSGEEVAERMRERGADFV